MFIEFVQYFPMLLISNNIYLQQFLTIFDYLIFCLFIAFVNIAFVNIAPHKEREKVPTKFWLRVLVKSPWKQKS